MNTHRNKFPAEYTLKMEEFMSIRKTDFWQGQGDRCKDRKTLGAR
jgi:hypothetical protein